MKQSNNVKPIKKKKLKGSRTGKVVIYVVCIFLAILSIMPFFIMIINSTRSTPEVQQHAIALLPSNHLAQNWEVLEDKPFNPFIGFLNSLTISTSATLLAIYFSTLTAYALFAYRWKLRQPFFTLIMAIMMIPAQVTSIGFYHFMYEIGMTNNFLALILPGIAAPITVFFMRQYMLSSLNLDIVASARIDGAGEFRIFNGIVLPIMKPAMATQAIFTFVFNWNNLFVPMILLTKKENFTMPIMVSLLKGDIYKTEYGAVYLALTLSVLPLFIVYFALSRYIVAGVALGSVKE
jgi:multiple sugar transport system permease protein